MINPRPPSGGRLARRKRGPTAVSPTCKGFSPVCPPGQGSFDLGARRARVGGARNLIRLFWSKMPGNSHKHIGVNNRTLWRSDRENSETH
jgi:hypothetical protein